MDMDWRDAIKVRFPDWGSDTALSRWPAARAGFRFGQSVSGKVISRAPFGVWLDIGGDFPALLLVPNMRGAKLRRITFEDYPAEGTVEEGRINALGERGEIGVTQEQAEDDPWREPAKFAVGKKFVGPVVRILEYGFFVEIQPGVWALLRPDQTAGTVTVGDEVRVRVISVDPGSRKVEVSPVMDSVD